MPVVRFPWDAQLVRVRRELVPSAEWDGAMHAWLMTPTEAETFLHAAQARMYFNRLKCTVSVGDVVWVLGFAKDTPYRLGTGGTMTENNAPLV